MAQRLESRVRRRPGAWLPDPAWCFLIAGIGAIGSAVLIPAGEALDEARYRRDVALTWEQERLERLSRHEAFLGSVIAREPATVRQLQAMHLNRYPEGMTPLSEPESDPALASASVFAMLEPVPRTPPDAPAHTEGRSMLASLATGERSRLWLMAAGAVGVLLGLMPPRVRVKAGPAGRHAADATVPA
ncbi:MAG: hypothetical protein AAFR96_01625 [Planctomycetota bacterium]